jgi:guanyl-specific ribonuclease Sa
MPLQRGARRPLIALLALSAALAVGYGVRAWNDGGTSGDPTVRVSTGSVVTPATSASDPLSALPPDVAATVRLIQRGGPFPYPDNDGAVFHNFEHVLPTEPDGYYHEYTVPTPGSADRGERRVVTGQAGEYWYTDDHYETFERLDVGT